MAVGGSRASSTGTDIDFERDLPAGADAAAAARFDQFESVARTIRRTCADSPVLMVLDDLHWADIASVRLLDFLASVAPRLRVRHGRDVPPDRDRSLGACTTLARLGTTVPMPGLNEDAVQEMLAADLGEAVSPTVVATSRPVGRKPVVRPRLAGLMTLAGRVDVAPASVPDAVTAVIERRLAFLTEPTVAVLQAAAVLGREFTLEGVSAVVDAPVDEVGDALEPALRSGLLIEEARRLEFGHDLVRQVVLESISASRRREPAPSSGRGARCAPCRGPVAARDRRRSPHPGRPRLRGRREPPLANGHGAARSTFSPTRRRQRASVGHAQSPSTSRGETPSCSLTRETPWLRAGDLAAARARFAECAVAARTAGASGPSGRSFTLGMGTGPSGFEVPLPSSDQVGLLHDALALLPPDDKVMRSRLLARLSVAGATPEGTIGRKALAEEALALAEETGDPQLVAQALAAVNDALGGPDHVEQRRANAEQIVALAREAGDLTLSGSDIASSSWCTPSLGDFAAHDSEIEMFARLADRLRQPLVSWYIPLFRGAVALLHGRFAEAERRQREVADAATTTGSVNAELAAAATQLLCIRVDTNGEPPADFLDIIDMDPAEWASYAAGLSFVAAQTGDSKGRRHCSTSTQPITSPGSETTPRCS